MLHVQIVVFFNIITVLVLRVFIIIIYIVSFNSILLRLDIPLSDVSAPSGNFLFLGCNLYRFFEQLDIMVFVEITLFTFFAYIVHLQCLFDLHDLFMIKLSGFHINLSFRELLLEKLQQMCCLL
jgi:hypothetical protein